MNAHRDASDGTPLVAGEVLAWRAWTLTGADPVPRLRSVGCFARVWPPREPIEARCERWRLHRAPSLGCTCGIHATRELALLQRTRGPTVIGTVALWGTIVEHTLGYRARSGYPQRLGLVCPICFWQRGTSGSDAPVVVASLRGGERMPLCGAHLGTVSAVGPPVRHVMTPEEVLAGLLDLYGAHELVPTDTAPGT
jgi:hypothetical protein